MVIQNELNTFKNVLRSNSVPSGMQYAPNCSATLNPPSRLWLLKSVHISTARGHRSLNNTFLEVFSSL